MTQRQAAANAGVSKDQEVTAIRVANVPQDVFEAAVESDSPPPASPRVAHNGERASPGRRPARRLLGMESAPTMIELFPHETYDVIRRRWVKARHRATLADLGMDGAPFRIVGAPERREVRDAGTLTAGHLARGR